MIEPEIHTTITKREFLRYCAAGLGGCLLAQTPLLPLLAESGEGPSGRTADDDFTKWTREALYYHRIEGGRVQCEKCPHGCVLGSNEVGICRSRVNVNGKLCTIAYGNPCAVHIDPVEKKPLFHFLPSTRVYSIAVAGCNFRCLNCQNWQISQVSPRETANVDLPPGRVVEESLSNNCPSIAYTYSEPTTFYEYALETSVLARKSGVRNILKSNGYINEKPLRRLCKSLDAANIDLKVFDESVYRTLNGGSLAPVLRTLKILREEGVWLEITNLVIPTWNDSGDLIKRMCEWIQNNGLANCPLHIDRFTPLYKLTQLPMTPVSTLEKARELALAAGLQYVYIGNVPGHPAESTFCPGCKKLIIDRKGFAILSNLVKDNRCTLCNTAIAGVWK